MQKTSNKISIARLVELCALKGLQYVVISPGSRNAPLTISFAEDQRFQAFNIPDERVAAFFGLGIGQSTDMPAILCCTSGSAALNYAPAIAEAYHQKIPMLILTADRPIEWIDQRAGQTMRQKGVYHNYIKGSFELIEEAHEVDQLWYNDRIINEAINLTTAGSHGPVHINVPLKEPLYETISKVDVTSPKLIDHIASPPRINDSNKQLLKKTWTKSTSILVIIGQGSQDAELSEWIGKLLKDSRVVVLTETTSNIPFSGVFSSIDRLIDSILDCEYSDFAPQLLITLGAAIVSKKIRFMLRQMEIRHHWHVDPYEGYIDTYQKLTQRIYAEPVDMFKFLSDHLIEGDKSNFKEIWKNRELLTYRAHLDYLDIAPWSDLKVMEVILENIRGGYLHTSSSTPIRYLQLFPMRTDLQYYCNRGLSGIDGCTSTAMGFAYTVEDHVTLITGDLSFFYDSNALWHHHVPKNFTILLINNEGGSIFRFVKGPEQSGHLEKHFEATHMTRAEYVAKAHNIYYESSDDLTSLQDVLWRRSNEVVERAWIIEIFTPRTENINILKEYFNHVKEQVHGEN